MVLLSVVARVPRVVLDNPTTAAVLQGHLTGIGGGKRVLRAITAADDIINQKTKRKAFVEPRIFKSHLFFVLGPRRGVVTQVLALYV